MNPSEAETVLAQTIHQIEKMKMAGSLKEFVFGAFHILEPGRKLIWNWHLDTLCGYLEALDRREIRRLIVNIPPGSMKSLIASVFYPTWVWIHEPSHKFLCGSNAQPLATRDSLKMRQLVTSEWFQLRWGIEVIEAEDGYEEEIPLVKLNPEQSQKVLFANFEHGHRESQGILATVTGKRADTLIIDDPHDAIKAESDTIRVAITHAWDTGWANRMNDVAISAVIVIMQRLHVTDMTGYLLDKPDQGWVRLAIPMRYDPDFTFDAGKDIGRPELNDPRTVEGELLFPERFPEEEVCINEGDLGPYGTAGQLQQQPNPKGGGEFRREWLNHYMKKPQRGHTYILVDPAGEKHQGTKGKRDFTAMAVIRIGADGNYYLIDAYRDRLGLQERTDILFRWHEMYHPLAVGYEKYGMQSDIVFIKKQMEDLDYRFKIIELGGSLAKEDRIRKLQPLFSTGIFWLPQTLFRTLWDGKTVDIIDQFVEQEYLSFPVAAFDDLFDCIARILDPDLDRKIQKPKKSKPRPKAPRRTRKLRVGY